MVKTAQYTFAAFTILPFPHNLSPISFSARKTNKQKTMCFQKRWLQISFQ